MNRFLLDAWRERKIETIIFIIGIVGWLFDTLFYIISDGGFNFSFSFGIYFIGLISLFGWFLLQLDKSSTATRILNYLFFIISFVLFLYFIEYVIDNYEVAYIISVLLEIVVNLLIALLLLLKPKNGFIFLLISISICTLFILVYDTIFAIKYDYYNLLFSTIVCICFYLESCIIVSKQLGYIALRKPSLIEQELTALRDKKELGIITAEEYTQKRNEIMKKLI